MLSAGGGAKPEPTRWGEPIWLQPYPDSLLEGLPVDVWAMDEGTLFGPEDTVLLIEGVYPEWAKYETALLGFLCQASGIATKAARCKSIVGELSRWLKRPL